MVPELVIQPNTTANPSEYKRVDYNGFIPILLEALNALQADNDALALKVRLETPKVEPSLSVIYSVVYLMHTNKMRKQFHNNLQVIALESDNRALRRNMLEAQTQAAEAAHRTEERLQEHHRLIDDQKAQVSGLLELVKTQMSRIEKLETGTWSSMNAK